jgi:hypothetical protein
MTTLLHIALAIALLAVLGVLIAGIVNMMRRGDPQKSNKLMQSRVMLQAVALVILALLMLLSRS